MAFPDDFETARLSAERLTPAHLDAIRLMDTNPEYMAHLGGVRDSAQTEAYLARNLAHWTEYGFGLWVLRDKPHGQLAGRACLRHLPIDGVDEVEVGYGFLPTYWGRGLATEIAAACRRYAEAPIGVPSLIALTLPTNHGSRHVMTKIGMVYERDIDHEGVRHVLYRTSPKPAA
ncbi:MAG TPA: GNAT family N-acetyltransferase [Gemmatimonadales bacterium]|nr:GNAT family N-acetyltransferase [Gemmatimonadales bacterium]